MIRPWQFGALKTFGYDLLVVDPPWQFELYSEAGEEKSAQAQYETMTLDQIKALRIGELARRDCLLLMWATSCMIPQCLEAMAAWGFVYKSEIVWLKTTRTGKLRWGTGYRVRTLHEPVLVGTIGNPQHDAFPSAFYGLARQHSRKPEEFYSLIDACAPDLGFRADVFSRTNRTGWDAYGNETGKFTTTTEFAAAEANDSAPPIRPMSVSGRADLGSSGGGESCVLGRAEISKHGQPRQPDAHGPDAGGNPAKLGAPIKRVEGPHLQRSVA